MLYNTVFMSWPKRLSTKKTYRIWKICNALFKFISAQDEINLKRAFESVDDILKSTYKTKINRKKTEVMV